MRGTTPTFVKRMSPAKQKVGALVAMYYGMKTGGGGAGAGGGAAGAAKGAAGAKAASAAKTGAVAKVAGSGGMFGAKAGAGAGAGANAGLGAGGQAGLTAGSKIGVGGVGDATLGGAGGNVPIDTAGNGMWNNVQAFAGKAAQTYGKLKDMQGNPLGALKEMSGIRDVWMGDDDGGTLPPGVQEQMNAPSNQPKKWQSMLGGLFNQGNPISGYFDEQQAQRETTQESLIRRYYATRARQEQTPARRRGAGFNQAIGSGGY